MHLATGRMLKTFLDEKPGGWYSLDRQNNEDKMTFTMSLPSPKLEKEDFLLYTVTVWLKANGQKLELMRF